ncbi:MAG: hydrogenase maturation nickel metallochaperone HypA [Deltaproteobacteria bacterium]|nr:hydrogenase maturation nickel metallochaperone HypA [Deltaproteobacteria bacterium]
MHELSLVQSLLQLIGEQAAEHGFSRVNEIYLSCGRLSSIEPEALKFAFKTLSEGTLCAQARLELTILPLKVFCFSCEREIECGDADPTRCPLCQGDQVMVSAGFQELKIIEVDVD